MIGKDFWENFDIDVQTINITTAAHARELLEHYGESLTEEDIMQLSGRSRQVQGGTSAALAEFMVEGYKERKLTPKKQTIVTRRQRVVRWITNKIPFYTKNGK